MVATKLKSTKKASARNRAAAAQATLKAFHHGIAEFENFGFSRFWWDGDGPREGIASRVLKKFQPKIGDHDEPDAVTAARTDLLLPPDAQSDYMDVHHLLERFDAMLPAHETHAFVQVTLHFPEAINMHSAWEEVRAFAMKHFVLSEKRRLAVILTLHAPCFAGSGSVLHAHLAIPLRRLGSLGWGEMERHLPNDRGREETFAAWTAFRTEWAKVLGDKESA